MPELPEVETIRRGLAPLVTGAVLASVKATDRKILDISAANTLGLIEKQRIQQLLRRGKYLVFQLERHFLIFHLGMTGQLTLRDPLLPDSTVFQRTITGLETCDQHAPDRHTHLHILLQDGKQLLFRDIRKFGRVYVLACVAEELEAFFKRHRLGLEPFTPDYSLKSFLAGFKNRSLCLKSLLLDQRFVAGVGNIYADEALFEAGLNPTRRVRTLKRSEKAKLFEAVRQVLDRGIRFGGTSFRDFVNSNGEKGVNQEKLRVYGRHGEPCLACGTPIVRIVVGQRGTHFCPSCQPPPASGRK